MEEKDSKDIDSIIKGQWDSILNVVNSNGIGIDYNASRLLYENDIDKLYGSSSIDYNTSVGSILQSVRELQREIDKQKDSIKDKGILTIKNPHNLNNKLHSKGLEWEVTYVGRDLSLTEDNYCWDIVNTETGVKGYYLIERELVNEGEWVYVRWGRSPVSPKERREVINKSRLKNKDRILKDMISAIENSPY